MLRRKISRRQFLRNTAVAGTLAFPYIVPSSVLGNAGSVAPGNRIAIGCIGQVILFRGSQGWVFANRNKLDAHPKSLLKSVCSRQPQPQLWTAFRPDCRNSHLRL